MKQKVANVIYIIGIGCLLILTACTVIFLVINWSYAWNGSSHSLSTFRQLQYIAAAWGIGAGLLLIAGAFVYGLNHIHQAKNNFLKFNLIFLPVYLCVAVLIFSLFQITAAQEQINFHRQLFTDSKGVEWRILTEDQNGNQLIITEQAQGGKTVYNNTNVYSRLNDSNGLRPALNAWYTDQLAPEIREVALPVENVDSDVRAGSFDASEKDILAENKPAGITWAGNGLATPENAAFVLSVSEVNQYNDRGNFLDSDEIVRGIGWLRSPGIGFLEGDQTFYAVAFVTANEYDGSKISSASATSSGHFHPALWIAPIIEEE